uniref:Putative salivary kunitz domain protein n=1 Tax=Ixodes ricinus TaxID=34613 RepID=A0A0K8RGA9_IXORI
MKATIATLCFLAAAVCVIALLPEDICRAPHPMPSCTAGTVKKTWYFNNGTNKCEKYDGCGKGMNDFGSRFCCEDSCPYGKK